MTKLLALCAEGARRYGDDPQAIANFVEREIDLLPLGEQRILRCQLLLLTDQEGTQKPVS